VLVLAPALAALVVQELGPAPEVVVAQMLPP